MARSYTIVSGDGHLDVSSEGWVPYIPEKWRVRAPRRVTLGDGNEALVMENRPPMSPTGLVGTVQNDRPVSFDSEGSGPPAQRLREQDMDGVEAEVLFTHPMYMRFWRGIREDEGYKAMIHAYNRWLIEEYCAHAPDRLLAMAVSGITAMASRTGIRQEIRVQGHLSPPLSERQGLSNGGRRSILGGGHRDGHALDDAHRVRLHPDDQ